MSRLLEKWKPSSDRYWPDEYSKPVFKPSIKRGPVMAGAIGYA